MPSFSVSTNQHLHHIGLCVLMKAWYRFNTRPTLVQKMYMRMCMWGKIWAKFDLPKVIIYLGKLVREQRELSFLIRSLVDWNPTRLSITTPVWLHNKNPNEIIMERDAESIFLYQLRYRIGRLMHLYEGAILPFPETLLERRSKESPQISAISTVATYLFIFSYHGK